MDGDGIRQHGSEDRRPGSDVGRTRHNSRRNSAKRRVHGESIVTKMLQEELAGLSLEEYNGHQSVSPDAKERDSPKHGITTSGELQTRDSRVASRDSRHNDKGNYPAFDEYVISTVKDANSPGAEGGLGTPFQEVAVDFSIDTINTSSSSRDIISASSLNTSPKVDDKQAVQDDNGTTLEEALRKHEDIQNQQEKVQKEITFIKEEMESMEAKLEPSLTRNIQERENTEAPTYPDLTKNILARRNQFGAVQPLPLQYDNVVVDIIERVEKSVDGVAGSMRSFNRKQKPLPSIKRFK